MIDTCSPHPQKNRARDDTRFPPTQRPKKGAQKREKKTKVSFGPPRLETIKGGGGGGRRRRGKRAFFHVFFFFGSEFGKEGGHGMGLGVVKFDEAIDGFDCEEHDQSINYLEPFPFILSRLKYDS